MIEVRDAPLPVPEQTKVSESGYQPGRATKYPFAFMKVGQSFFIPASAGFKPSYVKNQCAHWQVRLGEPHKFCSAKLANGDYQIWRTD